MLRLLRRRLRLSLGDLLLHLNRLNDAEVRLQQSLALDSAVDSGAGSFGILRARQGRFDEATKALQAAVKGVLQTITLCTSTMHTR